MLERLTEQGRSVIVLAQQEARDLHEGFLGTEHLLLGLLVEDSGAAAAVLASFGVSLDGTRIFMAPFRGKDPPSAYIPLSDGAKKVLDLAEREADKLGHFYIGTGHLLIGVAGFADGLAAQFLSRAADLDLVRTRAVQQMREDPDGEGGYLRGAHLARAGRVHGSEIVGGIAYDSRDRNPPSWHALLPALAALEARLAAIEQQLGTAPEPG